MICSYYYPNYNIKFYSISSCSPQAIPTRGRNTRGGKERAVWNDRKAPGSSYKVHGSKPGHSSVPGAVFSRDAPKTCTYLSKPDSIGAPACPSHRKESISRGLGLSETLPVTNGFQCGAQHKSDLVSFRVAYFTPFVSEDA